MLTASKTAEVLPEGIVEKDLTYPKWNKRGKTTRVVDHFEMYYVEGWGWVILTLLIARAGSLARARGISTDRSYGVCVDKPDRVVTVGRGPHVKRHVTVHVWEPRQKTLQKFLDMRDKGAVMANQIRDRISSHRAQGIMRRGSFSLGGW